MAAFNITRSRENWKPGRRVLHVEGTWNSTDTTATLQVPKGNIISVGGFSQGSTTPEFAVCSDTPANGVIVPTTSGGSTYINIARSGSGSGKAFSIDVEYDSQ